MVSRSALTKMSGKREVCGYKQVLQIASSTVYLLLLKLSQYEGPTVLSEEIIRFSGWKVMMQ